MTHDAEEIDLALLEHPVEKPRRPYERVPGQLAFYIVAGLLILASFGPHLLSFLAF